MNRRGQAGFTIIEVFIVLAASSLLLIAAISAVRANQRRVEFSQAVRDFENQMSDIINDVPNGYFLSNSNLDCQITGNNPPQIRDISGPPVNSNDNCIYIGKALQYSPNGATDRLLVFNLVGRRNTITGDPVTSLAEAKPVAAYTPTLDTTLQYRLLNGLTVKKIFNADTNNSYGILAVTSTIGGTTTAHQASRVGGIQGSPFGSADKQTAVNSINTLNDTTFEIAQKGIVICLVDPYGREASLTVGENGTTTTRLDVDQYNSGCDA